MRTVALVLIGQAAIDNGGLKYFFENDWLEGVTYSHFADAYERIGHNFITIIRSMARRLLQS